MSGRRGAYHRGPNGNAGVSTLPMDVIEHRKSVIRVSAHKEEARCVLGLSRVGFDAFLARYDLTVGTHFLAVLDRLQNWENRA